MAYPDENGLIRCGGACHRLLPDEEYHRNAARYDGRDTVCKACKQVKRRERAQREKAQRQAKRYWEKEIESYEGFADEEY